MTASLIKLLRSNLSPLREYGAAILPSGRTVQVQGSATQVPFRSSSRFREEIPIDTPSTTLPPWETLHTHPQNSHWLDNGPSHWDIEMAGQLPKGATHRIVHPSALESFSVPSQPELLQYINALPKKSMHPWEFVDALEGRARPPEFADDSVGLVNRIIQEDLKAKGLLVHEADQQTPFEDLYHSLKSKLGLAKGGAVPPLSKYKECACQH